MPVVSDTVKRAIAAFKTKYPDFYVNDDYRYAYYYDCKATYAANVPHGWRMMIDTDYKHATYGVSYAPNELSPDLTSQVRQIVYAAINEERTRIIRAIEDACDSLPVEDFIGDPNDSSKPREAYIALNRVRDAIKVQVKSPFWAAPKKVRKPRKKKLL